MTGAGAGMDRAQADYMGMLATVINAPGPAGHARAARPAHPGADGHPHGAGRRALHPPPGHPPPREGPGRDLRRRHRQPVLHHRHARRAAGRRDRGRRPAEGHPLRASTASTPPTPSSTPTRPSSTRSPTSTCSTGACKAMDPTAITLCMDNALPIVVFDLLGRGNVAVHPRGQADRYCWSDERRSCDRRDPRARRREKMAKAVEPRPRASSRRPHRPGRRRPWSRSCRSTTTAARSPCSSSPGSGARGPPCS